MTIETETGQGEPLDVVIAGAGVAGLEAAFALRKLAGDRVGLTLLSPADEFVYRPMSVREPFSTGRARRYPLAALAARAGADVSRDGLACVDAARRAITTVEGAQLAYDALLLCPGAVMRRRYERAITLDDARIDEQLHGLVQDVEDGYVKHLAIIVPPVTSWPLPAYELALMCSERAWDREAPLRVTLLTPEEAPLVVFGQRASLDVTRLLAARGVEVITSAYCEITGTRAILVRPGERTLSADRIIALPELCGPSIPGLAHDSRGFLEVDHYARVWGTERVWAAGDATDFPLKHGGVAAQMADTAAQAIAALTGACAPPPPFEPALEGLLLTGGTSRYLRGGPTGGQGDDSAVIPVPHGLEPPKIAARYLTPHLIEMDRAAASPST